MVVYNNRNGNRPVAGYGQSAGQGMATAPYNFVTLPDKVVPSPLDQNLDWYDMEESVRREKFKEYIVNSGTLSGHLELELETVTPCFVGGNGESFYAPNGVPVIPGSTLRGLTKNLLKIVTCGSMRRNEDFYDRHLYFRCFASPVKSLREAYNKRMVKTVLVKTKDGKMDRKGRTKAAPGYLIRINGDYFMCPAEASAIYSPRECNKGASIVMYGDGSADVFTGPMHKKKTYMHIINPEWGEKYRIPVPKNVIEDYREDKGRKGLDLFQNGKRGAEAGGFAHDSKVDFVVPCYYVEQDGAVVHFGHGRYYRIAYQKSIGDHVPEVNQKETVDFADAMFGKKEWWAGRLFFEDALLEGNPSYLEKSLSHPLMSPNPTSFQLYLKQGNSGVKHWDDNAELRGYKFYWHQNIESGDWQIGEQDAKVNGMKEIRPLAKGSRFKGIIHFSNLSEVELGALCKVFNLGADGEDIVYKVGQGKSIGMGSVRIIAKLFIEDTSSRYAALFNGNAWNESLKKTDMLQYCAAFTTYQDKVLGQERKRYESGMKELRAMMDWRQTKNKNWKEKMAMMNPTVKDANRLKNRIPLDDALTFVEKRYQK